jgi:hypothetical protein
MVDNADDGFGLGFQDFLDENGQKSPKRVRLEVLEFGALPQQVDQSEDFVPAAPVQQPQVPVQLKKTEVPGSSRGTNAGIESTPFRGVSRSARAGWRAKWNRKPLTNAKTNGKTFASPIEAALAYDEKVRDEQPEEKYVKLRNFSPEVTGYDASLIPAAYDIATNYPGAFFKPDRVFENPLGWSNEKITQTITYNVTNGYESPFGNTAEEVGALIATLPVQQKNDPARAEARRTQRAQRKRELEARNKQAAAAAAGEVSDTHIRDDDDDYRSLANVAKKEPIEKSTEYYDDEFGSDEELSDSEVYHSDGE